MSSIYGTHTWSTDGNWMIKPYSNIYCVVCFLKGKVFANTGAGYICSGLPYELPLDAGNDFTLAKFPEGLFIEGATSNIPSLESLLIPED